MLDFQERYKVAQITKENDQWRNIKSGKIVTVTGRKGRFHLHLKHESGRETTKEDHYFAGEYEPLFKAPTTS